MRDLRLRYLDVFRRQWALYRMKGTPEPVESGDNAIMEVPFDAEVKSGEVRVFADGERPLTGLLLLKQDEDGWLVVPVSEFTVPATEQEILVGNRVYQLWNAFTAPADFVSRSWLVETISSEDVSLLAKAMACVLAGEAQPDELVELVGCPIVSTDDPRLDYEREFARQPKKAEMRSVEPVAAQASGWFVWRRSMMGVAASFAILLGTVVVIMREPPQPSLEDRQRLAELAAVSTPPRAVVSEPVSKPPTPSAAVSEPISKSPSPSVVASEPAVETPSPVASEPAFKPLPELPPIVGEAFPEPTPVVNKPISKLPVPVVASEPVPEPTVEPLPPPVVASEPTVEPPSPPVEVVQVSAETETVASKRAAEPIEDRPKVLRERSDAKGATARKSAERVRKTQSRSRVDRDAECSKAARAKSMSAALCCDADDFDDDGGSEVGVRQAYDNKKKMSCSFDGDGGSEVGVRQAYDNKNKRKMSRLFAENEAGASSYELVHRFLTEYRSLPPREMVRLDEVVNHFAYAHPGSTGDVPVAVVCELAECPWNRERMLLCVGVRAKKAAVRDVEIRFSFNEARVRSHRLLGYGTGKQTVKDLWSVGKIGQGDMRVSLHELVMADDGASAAAELLTVGLTYRDSETAPFESSKVAVRAEAIIRKDGPSADFRFASAVAEFAELLRGSANRDKDAYAALLRRVRSGKGEEGTRRWKELDELLDSAVRAAESSRYREFAPTCDAAVETDF